MNDSIYGDNSFLTIEHQQQTAQLGHKANTYFAILLFAVLIYIAYICCRNKQSQNGANNSNRVGDSASKSQSTGGLSEDIVRESIGQYGDEGGGEDDVRGYDLVALRIQIPGSLHTGNVHFDALPLDSTRDKSLNFGKFQLLK